MSKPTENQQDQTEAPQDLISLVEAAKVYHVEQSSLRYWAAVGLLGKWRVGLGRGNLMLSRAQLERLLAERNRIRPA